MVKKKIYLDNAATTPVYKGVVKEMNKYYLERYGNPSSTHEFGEIALKAIQESRKKIASEIGAKPWEIIFTSGTTESNNMAFFGLAGENKKKKKIIISSIEHSSIFEICDILARNGYNVTEIPVNSEGILDIKSLEKEIYYNTLLVSIMHVNNEIGVIQDIERIGEICNKKGVLFHSDCAQSFGKLKIDVKKMNVDLLSAGAHKIGGPKGIGFLYIRDSLKIEPLIYGGGQERNLRGGTENVPGIAGFAKALEIVKGIDTKKIEKSRHYFISKLEELGGRVNGSKKDRIYNNINVSLSGIDGESLVIFLSLKGIYVSAGSACDSKKQKESKVLKAIGLNERERKGAVRISLNEDISRKDIDYVVEEIRKNVGKLRA